jgi:O-antigen/teichoic acid export membrane protein
MLMLERLSSLKQAASNIVRRFTTREGIKKFFGISLYRNAVYLILDLAIPSLTGFIFWVLAARLYSTENIGIASAAIAVNGLLVAISTLGLSNAIIRFLPGAGDRAEGMINSAFTVAGLVSILAAFIFIAGLKLWAPGLLSIRNSPVFFIMFVLLVPLNLFDTLCGVIYVAQRRSDLILLQDSIASLLRFLPLFLLATLFAYFGIFVSWGLALLIATIIGIFILLPKMLNGRRPKPAINRKIFGEMIQFSASNYGVSLLSMASSSILPLIVLNRLGAAQNAYFFVSWTISSTIATVPSAITTALFAEGSNNEKSLDNDVKRSLLFIFVLLVPLVIMVLFFGKWILLIFGAKYSQNALALLKVLTITALPLSINALYFTIKRIQKKMKSVIIMTGFISLVALALTYVLLPQIGLLGVGIGWLSANSPAALFIIIIWLRKKSLLR